MRIRIETDVQPCELEVGDEILVHYSDYTPSRKGHYKKIGFFTRKDHENLYLVSVKKLGSEQSAWKDSFEGEEPIRLEDIITIDIRRIFG